MHWFADLSAARQAGFDRPAPIPWAEMRAWSSLTDEPIEPWQASVLRRLDDLWCQACIAGKETQKANS